MSGSGPALPPRLRERIAADLRPVRPLAPPARRAAWLALLATASGLAAWLRLRSAAAPLSTLGLWVAAAQWLTGLAMVWVAMREGVPARGLGRVRASWVLAGGLAVQLLAALSLASGAATGWLGDGGAAAGLQCAGGQGALALPVLAIALFLLLRAFPLQARLASALAGAAAGLFADAAWHLVCTRTDLAHIVVWHFGSTLTLAAAGYLVGALAERRLHQPVPAK